MKVSYDGPDLDTDTHRTGSVPPHDYGRTIVRQRSYAGALRWAGLKELLYGLALETGVEYRTLEEDKGLLRTTVYFEVRGEAHRVDWFNDRLQGIAETHNGRVR